MSWVRALPCTILATHPQIPSSSLTQRPTSPPGGHGWISCGIFFMCHVAAEHPPCIQTRTWALLCRRFVDGIKVHNAVALNKIVCSGLPGWVWFCQLRCLESRGSPYGGEHPSWNIGFTHTMYFHPPPLGKCPKDSDSPSQSTPVQASSL